MSGSEPVNNDEPFTEIVEERTLLGRIANKDKQAFETLYRMYYSRVFQFVLRMTRQIELAEEITGDTMFTLWEKASTFEGRSNASTWILGIAYRRALKTLKKNKDHRHLDFDNNLTGFTNPKPETNPETVTSTEKLQLQIQQGINNLSRDHQAVLQRSAMGYGYSEIAEILSCPQNTVKTRMFYARRQLKNFLADCEQVDQPEHDDCRAHMACKKASTK
ncbi:MAG: sigma-70 family RNA polymerase sigma factor [Exilibacterium sp.]